MKIRTWAKIVWMSAVVLLPAVFPQAGTARPETSRGDASQPAEGRMPSPSRTERRQRLTIDECVSLGLRNSKGVHASGLRAEAASAKLKEMQAARLPSLKFAAGYTRLSEVPPFEVQLPFPQGLPLALPTKFVVSPNFYNNFLLKVGLQQPLFTGFRLRSASKMARLQADVAEQELAGDRMDLVFAVRAAYWSLFKAREIQRVVDENVEQVKIHLSDVRNFFEQGLLTRNEVLRAEVQLSNTRMVQLDAANGVETAGLWLNSLIGLPLDTEIDLATVVGEEGAEGFGESTTADVGAGDSPRDAARTAEDMVTKALARRPELKALGLRTKAGEAGDTLAKSPLYPQVFLSLNYYDMRPNSRLMPAQDRFYSTWDAGVVVSMDVWNWGQTGWQARQAEAQLAQAEDALGQMRDAVALEVRRSRLEFSRMKEKIAVAREAVAQAEENLRVTTDRFKEGVALNADVLDAEVALLQAGTGYTQSLVDFELAKAKLQRALGE